jgi:arsenate reductase (thioredoxin)
LEKEKKAEPGPRGSGRTRVLFVCVGNACRSPMAEAIARYDAPDVIEPHSAGVSPLGAVTELTREILLRNGYSPEGLSSDGLTREACDAADIIVNMTGTPRQGFYWSPEKVQDWIVQDPFGADTNTYQKVFEGIKRRVNQLAHDLREERQHGTSNT